MNMKNLFLALSLMTFSILSYAQNWAGTAGEATRR